MEHACIFCGNKFVVPYLDENNLTVSDVNGSTTTCGECGGKWLRKMGNG
jgi:DNA-directed RNA polymerase subunit RPC12/RpoP